MKGRCMISVIVLVLVLLTATTELTAVEGVTCVVTELSPCAGVISSGAEPSAECCAKLKEQEPCLCGYKKDPNLRQYVDSPNAKKMATSCKLPDPKC